MRALWQSDLTEQDTYSITGDSLHHLVNVVRIEVSEELLLLNGKGLQVLTTVESISKKELKLKFISSKSVERNYSFDVAIGMPKRDALETCLRAATELGFRKIYLIRSDFSQMKFPEPERTEKLLVSGLEQSNAPFLPEIIESEWSMIPWNGYGEIILLDSQSAKAPQQLSRKPQNPKLLIVGPEGGFSFSELQFLYSKEEIKVVNLPTPILRTPTALITGAGLMIESLLN